MAVGYHEDCTCVFLRTFFLGATIARGFRETP